MYGYANDCATDNNLVRNELSFQNLIAVANNKMLFEALDAQTQQELIMMIAAYTTACLSGMKKGEGDDNLVAKYFSYLQSSK